MSTTHKYPNTNHGLIIEVEDDRIWSSVGDYDEWLDNAFSIEKSDSSVRNMNTDVFGDILGHFGYLYEDSAIEHFSHLRNEPALKPTISYSTLGNVKNA